MFKYFADTMNQFEVLIFSESSQCLFTFNFINLSVENRFEKLSGNIEVFNSLIKSKFKSVSFDEMVKIILKYNTYLLKDFLANYVSDKDLQGYVSKVNEVYAKIYNYLDNNFANDRDSAISINSLFEKVGVDVNAYNLYKTLFPDIFRKIDTIYYSKLQYLFIKNETI